MIFTLGILDPESDSIPTAASIFSLLPFFPFSLLFFPLLFFPPFLFCTSDTHLSPSHPPAPFDCSFIPFLDGLSPFSVDSPCLLPRVAILRSSSILRPRTLRFFPPFFSTGPTTLAVPRHGCFVVLSSSNEISASSPPFMRTETLDDRFSTDRATRRVPRSGASPPNDLHRASEEPERDRDGKGGMARLNGYDLLWWSDRPLLDPQWSCSSTPSTVPRV